MLRKVCATVFAEGNDRLDDPGSPRRLLPATADGGDLAVVLAHQTEGSREVGVEMLDDLAPGGPDDPTAAAIVRADMVLLPAGPRDRLPGRPDRQE
jgi:hypothetical protein